jgi:predicted phosphodiesterase
VRIALISDLHGNLFALDAVLRELEHEEFDHLVCLGDVADGPQPCEALERVRRLGCPVIMGNWDAAFLHGMPDPHDEVSQKLADIGAFWADKLSPDQRAFVATFVPTLELPLDDGGHVLFFHGSPRSYDEWIFAETPDAEVEGMLEGREARVLVGGHTHLQLIRRLESGMFVNPGSVGLPFRHWWPNTVIIAPWAEYGLIEVESATQLRVDLRRTAYDVEALLDLSRESGMPHAEWWAGTWATARVS